MSTKTWFTCLVLTLTVACLFQQVTAQQLVININTISLFNGDNVTLSNTTNLVASEISNTLPAPPRVIYHIRSVTNGQFYLLNPITHTYSPVNQFTQADLNNGYVLFFHPGNQVPPSYILQAEDPLLGYLSANSTVSTIFTAFRRNTIGAPRPIFEASIDPTTLIVTLRITMFKKVLTTPEVRFNVGLSPLMTCLSNADSIRDGFVLVENGAYYNVYQVSMSLTSFLSNTNIQQISSGGVIDLVATMFADYMITTYDSLPAVTSDIYVVTNNGYCYQTIYTQRYILTLTLAVTRVNFGNSNPTSFLQPKKIFVNDLNRLEIRMIVWTSISDNITAWSVTGPYAFNVTDATFIGNSGGFNYYLIVMQSNVITSAIDFYGDYVLTLSSPTATSSIAYSLQYLVPYPDITQTLLFNTTAQTYADAALTVPRTQFSPTDTVYVRVDAPGAPVISGLSLSPYNVIMCCFLSFETIPSNVDCRNTTRADFSQVIFAGGQVPRDVDAGLVPPPTTTSYGFFFGFPATARTGADSRCFLTIETAYLVPNSTTRSVRAVESVFETTANPVANSVASVAYRVFDVIANNKNGGTGNGHTSSAATVATTNIVAAMIGIIAAVVLL